MMLLPSRNPMHTLNKRLYSMMVNGYGQIWLMVLHHAVSHHTKHWLQTSQRIVNSIIICPRSVYANLSWLLTYNQTGMYPFQTCSWILEGQISVLMWPLPMSEFQRSKWEISMQCMPYHWSLRHVTELDTILCPTHTTT